jgi:predicted ATPase
MITQIKLCFSHGLKVKGSHLIKFYPDVNVIVGPNGSGKSTLLRALHFCKECRKEETNSAGTCYFDSETMNPHRPDNPPRDIRDMILRARGIFSSHGEIMKDTLTSLPIRKYDVLLVDEPESGQDLAGVQRIHEGFDLLCSEGGQVITASHHPLIMQNAHLIELVPGYAETVRSILCQSVCENQTPRQNPDQETL